MRQRDSSNNIYKLYAWEEFQFHWKHSYVSTSDNSFNQKNFSDDKIKNKFLKRNILSFFF